MQEFRQCLCILKNKKLPVDGKSGKTKCRSKYRSAYLLPQYDTFTFCAVSVSKTNAASSFPIGHVNVQSCLLISLQYKPISLQNSWMSVEQPIRIHWVFYKHHWQFPIKKTTISILTCPIASAQESSNNLLPQHSYCFTSYNIPAVGDT